MGPTLTDRVLDQTWADKSKETHHHIKNESIFISVLLIKKIENLYF